MTTDDADELVLVGQGPVATVYAGVRDDAGFALKVYPGTLDRRTLRAVRTELTTLASLRGHAPVLVADSVEPLPGGRTGLRMELCAQSLAEFVEGAGRRPVDETLTMGGVLVEALAAAHGRGVVHGSVSPGNVLFQGSGTTLLSDFGTTLRRRFASDTSPHETAAPETLRDGSLDERSDLYGLGATLYFALTGHAPHPRYRGEPDDAYVLRVLSEPVAAIGRPDVPPALADLVLRLLAKNPADRPGSAAEVGARLRAVRAGAEQRPAPPLLTDLGEPILVSGPARRRRRWRLGPGPVVVGLASVAMLVVGAVLLLAYRPQDVAVPPAPAEIRGQATPSSPPTRTLHVKLAEPIDRGHYVELSWHSEAPLHYAVLIAVEGGGLDTVYVRDRTSHRVEVDPALGYCFRVHGTDGAQVYVSEVRSLRDAICSL